MKAFYSSLFPLNLPPGHRFPMAKYTRLRERLLGDGIVAADDLREAPAATEEELSLVHDPGYVGKVRDGRLSDRELRRIGFPWSPEMARRARTSVGATLAAARTALEEGYGVNLAGGTHHALRDAGSGYCVFNDLAVAAAALLGSGRVAKVLVLDLDVHQGNGTAALLRGREGAFTCSLHGRDNFPYRKEASDLDVDLPTGTDDPAYLAALENALEEIGRRFGRPDVVLYQAGADPHEHDRSGKLRLTLAGLARRDERVFAEFAPTVPVVVTMGGGYGPDVEVVSGIHAATVEAGCRAFGSLPAAATGQGS